MMPQLEYFEYPFRDKTLDLSRPKIMGILNTTPDSFSDGGLFISVDAAVNRIGQMVGRGAHIIDVGGESTRPGAAPVSAEEELNRVIPILEKAIPEFSDVLFSVDTTKYDVAQAALEAGVHIVNDVSGLRKEPRMAGLCGNYEAGYILMHSTGDPETMQDNPSYRDVTGEIGLFFREGLQKLRSEGVASILLDPGFGFGKTLAHNLEIASKLDNFLEFGYPLLVGASRKSMIGNILGGRPVEDRLTGTIAIHYHCMMKGARILRVHDVKEANDSIEIFNAVETA